jgi:bifunctional enzyme CysN/CysC
VVWEPWNIAREEREARSGHKAAVVWLTGLSGSGKSTLSMALERALFQSGCQTMLLDGDQVRHGLSGDLGFSPTDRTENIRRVSQVARLFFEQGSIVLCSFVSPYRADRDMARTLLPDGRFFEVLVECDLDTLRERDPKGLYARAAQGGVRNLTGVQAVYEEPETPELVLDTRADTVEASVARLLDMLESAGIISTPQGGR